MPLKMCARRWCQPCSVMPGTRLVHIIVIVDSAGTTWWWLLDNWGGGGGG
eukprot:SAG11_NODE_16699_length_540_cov_0.809524_1_plen_49_part_10